MSRRGYILSMTLLIAGTARLTAGSPIFTIIPATDSGIQGTLRVVDGDAIVRIAGEGKSWSDWRLHGHYLSNPCPITLGSDDDKPFPHEGTSLGFDRDGDGSVHLATTLAQEKQQVVRTVWKFDQTGDGTYVQVNTVCKYTGWYLTVAEKVEKAEDKDGKPYQFHRLLLTKEKTKRSLWDIGEVGR